MPAKHEKRLIKRALWLSAEAWADLERIKAEIGVPCAESARRAIDVYVEWYDNGYVAWDDKSCVRKRGESE